MPMWSGRRSNWPGPTIRADGPVQLNRTFTGKSLPPYIVKVGEDTRRIEESGPWTSGARLARRFTRWSNAKYLSTRGIVTCIRDNLDLIDAAIVGAGPAGLAAALYAARAGLKTVVFGNPYQSQLAKAGIVENYLTYDEQLPGLALVEKMIAHATRWGAELQDEEIRQIARDEPLFHLTTSKADTFCAYTVILAMGTKYRQLGVRGENEFYGKGVSYCTVCDGPLYQGQPVAVVGFGNEAAAAALRLSTIASSVDLIAVRPRLGADVILQARLDESANVPQFANVEVKEIVGAADGVTGIRFQSRMGEMHERAVKAVFVEVGTMPASALAADLGIELNGQFIRVNERQETNLPGVFAAGDITGAKARQAAIAVGDGTRAAIASIDFVKSLGLSAEKAKVQSVQWGAVEPKRAPEGSTGQAEKDKTPLHEYIRHDSGFRRVYESYTPDVSLTSQINTRLPEARVVVISATWCPDCRRNVPRLARIAEYLPNWKFEVYPREEQARAEELGIRAIPTFIVYQDGKELGRIIENPAFGSLEADLWEIARKARPQSDGR
jgi:thioredoxin reductase (NADPH)